MRYLKQIITLVLSLIVVSCTMDEEYGFTKGSGKDRIEVCARIANYDDCNVGTRSAKTNEEAKVTSMALALFPIDNDVLQKCIYYEYKTGGNVSFTIDRKGSIFNEYDGVPFVMYVFANVENNATYMGVGKTLTEFKNHVLTTQDTWYTASNAGGVGLPENGFPMIGSLGDADTDGKEFILKPTISTDNPHALPLVDGTPSDLLNIPMEVMFAKFSFSITLDPIQTLSGNTQSFTMSNYTLHNIPSSVDFLSTSNDEKTVVDASEDIPVNSTVLEGSNAEGNEGRGAITFSFYVPERYLVPVMSAADYPYPFKIDGAIRKEDEELRQRYKPALLNDGDNNEENDKKATYITIQGEYIDHNRRSWDVAYDIYLGNDNYSNFDIERNINYNNSVVIRGVTNSNDATKESIAMDHRVNITRSNPIIENIRREMLLDSHFEVRPLRIRAKSEAVAGKSVTVSVEPINTGDDVSWIRLEHKNDNTAKNGYDDYLSNGKRKYFTYGLVTGVPYSGSGTEENNISGNDYQTFTSRKTNDCVWIYVDECTDVYGFNSDGTVDVKPRSAKIVIRVKDNEEDEKHIYESTYIINQSKLYPIVVTGTDKVVSGTEGNWTATDANVTRTYHIESYEEYLYNYDAEDTYEANKTFYEGMAWGLEGETLSEKHKSLDITDFENYSRLNDNRRTEILNRVESFYDFYIGRHDFDVDVPTPPHSGAGRDFCDEIVNKVGIGKLELDTNPASAVEYCYNKNKRDREGNVVSTNWYLPAIDEIEDIMVGAYDAFDGVFQDQDYWSSQPSYHRCFFFMSQKYDSFLGIGGWTFRGTAAYYMDDTANARSTRATFDGYVNNIAKYNYNPSGVVVPEPYEEVINDITYEVWEGLYKWTTNRGGTYAEGDGVTSGQTYDYTNARVPNNSVYPKFGEVQEDGSRPRTEKNRIRCVRYSNRVVNN